MIFFLWVLSSFFLALGQSVFGGPNLVLFLVVAMSAFGSPRRGIVFAFLAGVILDLANLRLLGFSSSVFLVITGCILLYRRRFSPDHPLFLPLFAVLASLITRQSFWPFEVGIFVVLSFLVRQVYFWLFGHASLIGRLKL